MGHENSYLRLLRSGRYAPFFLSQTLTNLSDGLFAAAVIYFAVRVGGSPWQLGAMTFGITLSRGFLGPIGGVLGDRMNKRTYLVVIEIVRALLMVGLYLLIAADAVNIWLLTVFGILVSTLFAISVPAAKSIIPKLASPQELQPANALIQTITWPAFFCGSGLMAVILPLKLEGLTFAFIAGFFALSSLLLTRLPRLASDGQANAQAKKSLIADLSQGYNEMRSDQVLHARVWAYGIFTFFWRGSLQILIPLAVLTRLESPDWLFGALMLVNGAAEFVANLYVGRLRMEKPLVFTFLCEIILALGLAAIAVSFVLPVPAVGFLVGAFLIGVAAATIDIPLLTVIQMKVSERNIGKVVSYWFTIGSSGGALGSLCLGFYYQVMPMALGTSLLAAGLLLVGIMLFVWAQARNTIWVTAQEAK